MWSPKLPHLRKDKIMFGITEIEVFEGKKDCWYFRIVSGKNNIPRCISAKSYKTGDLAYAAAKRFGKLLSKVDLAPRFFHLPS